MNRILAVISTFLYFKSTSSAMRGGLVAAGFLLLAAVASAKGAKDYLKKPDLWFASAEGRQIAANILSWQADTGGWPKNEDTASAPFKGDRKKLKATFDNGATTDELRFLVRCINAAGEEVLTTDDTDEEDGKKGNEKPPVSGQKSSSSVKSVSSVVEKSYLPAFSKGLNHILTAQYPIGGWPQLYPPGKGYHRHITFNDNSMVRLMEFLREVHTSDRYTFVPAEQRKAAGESFDRGIQCVLKCQILVNGKRTVWCAQHDEVDCRPRDGRSFELASFSGSESVGIVRLLMSLEKPSPEVVAAVEGAVAWLDGAKIEGLRAERRRGADGEMKLVLEEDADAPLLWARFYDLQTGKPFFCDRDGIKKPSILDLAPERHGGYAWYGTWAGNLLEKEYPRWRSAR
ncbi:MAG: pectate lyase [Verrucomicrobiaceae bacterium]|nr:MAG: pectate lyase [Verrucomicrobiaceae bacterium]